MRTIAIPSSQGLPWRDASSGQRDIIMLHAMLNSCIFNRFAGGDIFVHAKCSNYNKLYELCQLLVRSFPPGAIEKQRTFLWLDIYQEGRAGSLMYMVHRW